eukprot:GEMP01001606.1.p1 GENE.GEMP01001606.1~~GEMP01001606.1.p1  ORF type:complete len:593 (+),score=81.15 GEMP01001606.1:152-1930(+)
MTAERGVFLYAGGDAYCGQWSEKNGEGRDSANVDFVSTPSDDDTPCPSTRASEGFPQRVGWGAYIMESSEAYEGEWSSNRKHGLGYFSTKTGTRLIGRFENNDFVIGLCVAPNGVLYEEDRDVSEFGNPAKQLLFVSLPNGQLTSSRELSRTSSENPSCTETNLTHSRSSNKMSRTSSSCSSTSVSSPALSATGFELQKERSNAKAYTTWTTAEATYFAQCLQLSPSVLKSFRKKRITGKMLSSMLMSDPRLESLFPDPAVNRPSRKMLKIALTLLQKLKERLCRKDFLRKQVGSARIEGLRINYNDIEFESVIGEGGYGRVYKGKWMSTPVATKVFRSRSQLHNDFYAELLCLSRLRHPNITNLLAICLEPRYCILTEFVQCGSLFDLLHRHTLMPWSLVRSVSIARKISSGMSFLHSQRILHCDLKSSNILISDCWEVKICDFGLAHLLPRSHPRIPNSGIAGACHWMSALSLGCVGTHHWMAPEVLRGEMYSMASDVYSFGMIFWETICRKIPLAGYTGSEVIALVGYGKRKPYLHNDCPKSISTILRNALTTSPQRRHTFRALGAALEKLHAQSFLDVEENLSALLVG